jgi:hypothetical protein
MLSFPIKSIREANSGAAILIFHWYEMFSPDAPDTYQPKLMDIPALVDEIENVAGRAIKSQKWDKHLKLIQEELKSQCDINKLFLDRLNNYGGVLEQLATESNLVDVCSIAKLLKLRCKEFNEQAIKELEESVAKLPGKKEEAIEALKRVATIALRSGRTEEDYKHIFIEANLGRTPTEIVAELIMASNPVVQEYTCILAVRGTVEELRVIGRKAKFTILTEKHFPPGEVSTKFRELTPKDVWLSIKEPGSKPIEAARSAIRRIRTALDIFNFYRHATLSFRDEVLVVDDTSQAFLVSPQQEWSWQKRSKKSAKSLSKQLIGEVDEKRFSGRVLNALEHYSLAQTSAAARIRLVNIWSALECLTTREDSSSIMDGVCKAVAPIVTWRRTSKILSYTAKKLIEYKELAGGKLGAGFPEDENGLSNERLMLALAKAEGHPHAEELILFTKDNVYLRNRIFILWKAMSQPQELANELKMSSKRVEWHLYRIYRARNLIIHEGEEVPHVSRLLENLHYYFSVTLSRILQSMQVNPSWEVTDAITYWRTRHNHIMNCLTNEKAHVLRPCDFQPIYRKPLNNEYLWQEVKRIA